MAWLRVDRLGMVTMLVILFIASEGTLAGKKEEPGKLVEDTTWGVSFRAPKFKRLKDHPLEGQPNYILWGEIPGKCSLDLSAFVETVPWGTSASDCRLGFPGNPEGVAAQPEYTLIRQEEEPVTFTLYDNAVGGGVIQNQLYAYWTRDDLCFEIHISAMNCDVFETRALPIIQSIALSEDTGATLETVALASEFGGQPGDWGLHLMAASVYLHDEEEVKPELARRFYGSALERGGEEMNDYQRWIAEEGIALALLAEDKGAEAIYHLQQALQLASSWSNASERAGLREETLFNLACAHPLAGNSAEACSSLQELLRTIPPGSQTDQVRDIETDPQLSAVRASECYQKLGIETD